MKPAYDGIAGWLLVLAGVVLVLVGWGDTFNGIDFLALLIFGAGIAMVSYRVGSNGNNN